MEEKYRKPSEEKWANVLKDLAEGKEWVEGVGIFVDGIKVAFPCGYCAYREEMCYSKLCEECKHYDVDCEALCVFCPLPKARICRNEGSGGTFATFIFNMNRGRRDLAKKNAERILNYIKNDKEPKDV
jgi:hypothetical protein